MTGALNVTAEAVMAPFVGKNVLTNRQLFEQLALQLELPEETTAARTPVGKAAKPYNLFERKVRWHQQTLKRLGVLEQVARGTWRLSEHAQQEMTPAPRRTVLLAFSTDLGCALWGNAEDVFTGLGEAITLAFTSPPYPLAKQRAYGNVDQAAYVDWLIPLLEPIVKHLRPGGSVVLNVGNDIFEPKSPARSLYLERLTLAIHDRLGLHLMDRMVWHNPTKAPSPVQWASLKRVQLNAAYEHMLWFTNDPHRVIADNRRCLQPHTEAQQRLIARGGERRYASYSGGAYNLREGSFSNQTEGTITRNVLTIPHRCQDQTPARDYAKLHGMSQHPGLMPLALADHFVKFLSDVGDLVVDQFGGWGTTGRAAELNNRPWLITERCREYLMCGAQRFRAAKGFRQAWDSAEARDTEFCRPGRPG